MASSSKTSSVPTSRRTTWVVLGVVALILVALLIAVFTSGSSSEDGVDGGDVTTPSELSEQNQPVTVGGAVLPPLADPASDPAVGTPAPGLEGRTFDGTTVNITPGDGQAYMVVFLAHWCPHCNAEIPRLVSWFESGRVPENLRVVGISTAVASDRPNYPPSEWIVETKWPWEIMADSAEVTAAEAYGVSGFPFFAVIGEDGLVKVRASGELEAEELERIVEAALAS